MSHNYFWLDTDTLMTASLGGRFREGSGFYEDDFAFDTSVYQVSVGRLTTHPSEVLTGWKVQPTNAQTIAYRREAYRLYTNDQSERLWEWALVELEIAHREGSDLIPLYIGEGGCNLAWSPDGHYLAYTYPLDGLTFCNGAQGSVEFLASPLLTITSAAVEGDYFSPMGWLLVSGE